MLPSDEGYEAARRVWNAAIDNPFIGVRVRSLTVPVSPVMPSHIRREPVW